MSTRGQDDAVSLMPAVVAAAQWFAILPSNFLAFCKGRCRPSRTVRRLLSFLRYSSSTKTMCLPSLLFWDFSHGSFNVDITRATVLMNVGESVRSLLFVIMVTHLVTGRFSHTFYGITAFMTMISKSWVASLAIFQRRWRLAHPCCFVDQLAWPVARHAYTHALLDIRQASW